jgi:hypothetical protein
MAESKLPPGPWTEHHEKGGGLIGFKDATGQRVLGATLNGYLAASSPEVLRAIEALPTLVEAAHRSVLWLDVKEYDHWDDLSALRDALAKIDGRD